MNRTYTLLIVDDEKKTREGLRKHIDWQALGVGHVKIAASSEEALKVCAWEPPDIIISDIRMPGMDGITLCAYIREQLPECQIIFLSGHTDKEYLKAAIDLDAVSYVEKPIDTKAVEAAVKKAVQRKQKIKMDYDTKNDGLIANAFMLRQRVILQLVNRRFEESLSKELYALGIFTHRSNWFRVILIKFSGEIDNVLQQENILSQKLNDVFAHTEQALAFRDDKHAVIILSCEKQTRLHINDADLRRFIKDVEYLSDYRRSVFCALGEIFKNIDKVLDSYRGAVLALQKLFFMGFGNYCSYRDGQEIALRFDMSLINDFSACIDARNQKEALRTLDNIYKYLHEQTNVMPSSIKNIYFRLGYQLESGIGVDRLNQSKEKHYVWEDFLELSTIYEIHSYIREMTERILCVPEGHFLVSKAKTIINSSYTNESLSLHSISRELCISPSYLSNLFKRETGMTIGQFISKVRMERAKILLLDNNLKIYHVAMMVGYSDTSYFTKVFKRNIGIMPSEYRDGNL